MGATKRPAYRVIAIDKRRSRDGRALEILGFYDPLTEPATVQLDTDKIKAWIGKGAQPSDTVVKLMRQAEQAATQAAEAEKPKRATRAAKPKPSKRRPRPRPPPRHHRRRGRRDAGRGGRRRGARSGRCCQRRNRRRAESAAEARRRQPRGSRVDEAAEAAAEPMTRTTAEKAEA